jgi:eukaryotic-like serine/threonine-protein kinase
MQQRRFVEAEKLLQENLQSSRRVLGPEHPSTLATLNNLGYAYAAQGRLRESEQLLRENLSAERGILGPDHPQTIETTFNLAGTYNRQGRYGQAEQLATEAIAGYERTKFDDNEPVGTGWCSAVRSRG